MTRATRRVQKLPTWALRVLNDTYDALPASMMADHRAAIKEELLARELPSLADQSGGYAVAPIRGQQ